jgi:hypothetical protein
MEEAETRDSALPAGAVILDGKYKLERLLHQRPRVNLYLGRRLPQVDQTIQGHAAPELPVAIRELVLTGLSPQLHRQIEQAAFEEFVSPAVPGLPRWPGAGDHIRLDGDRHYLVMQLQRMRSERHPHAITLADLLLIRREWPQWLNMHTALKWGVQLCRIVARLHRLGSILGDLNPSTVLVDRTGTAAWAPALLFAWPPAPHFWPYMRTPLAHREHIARVFPIGNISADNPFVAPETLKGTYDESSDVYSLGALLYLLLTGYAPPSAMLRLGGRNQTMVTAHSGYASNSLEKIELIPPHFLNVRLPLHLEGVLLRALELDPSWRYTSVFELAEALEAIELVREGVDASVSDRAAGGVLYVDKALRWLKRQIKLNL